MRLTLPIPPEWSVTLPSSAARHDEVTSVQVPATELVIKFSALFNLPDDPSAWARQRLQNELPAGKARQIIAAFDLKTTDGWPVTVIQSEVQDAMARSYELHVFYTFLHHAAWAEVRTGNAKDFEQHREQILDVLGQARPDFSGQGIVAISQLWDGLPEAEAAAK